MIRNTSLWGTWKAELSNIIHDRSVMLVMIGGILFYALLYPLPYQKNVPGQQALAVLDQDRSVLARQLIRMADATPQLRVAAVPQSMGEATALLENDVVHGLLVIPANFERDVYLGRPVNIAFAGDASYFLIYGNIVEGLLKATTTLSVETQIISSFRKGSSPANIPGEIMPFRMSPHGVFNPTGGYINYIVPAVFVLILHQTLLIAAGTVTIKDRARRLSGLVTTPLRQALPIRLVTFVFAYLILALLYFGFFFQLYGVPHAAPQFALIGFSLLFLTSTTLFAILLGYLLPRPELTTVIVLLSSLPIVFTAGFAWPASNLPEWLDSLTMMIPAKPGIQGFLSLNQMGAPIQSLTSEIAYLSGLSLFFGLGILLLAMSERRRSSNRMNAESAARSY